MYGIKGWKLNLAWKPIWDTRSHRWNRKYDISAIRTEDIIQVRVAEIVGNPMNNQIQDLETASMKWIVENIE